MPSAHLMQQNKHHKTQRGACINAMAADLVNVHQSALDPRPLTNVLIMSVGFFFIKGGFIPVQSFASSLLNFSCIPMGDISIGLVRTCTLLYCDVVACSRARHKACALRHCASVGLV
jgi:hypothetical protein